MVGLFEGKKSDQELASLTLHSNGRFTIPANCDNLKRLICALVNDGLSKQLLSNDKKCESPQNMNFLMAQTDHPTIGEQKEEEEEEDDDTFKN